MKKQKGFTFVELLAVIVILGLLITFATIAIRKLKEKQDKKNYLNEISAIFTGAKAFVADYPERLVFGTSGDNPYKCSGVYSVYKFRDTGGFEIIREGEENPLYIYLEEKLYKLNSETGVFEKFTFEDESVAYTWDNIGQDYKEDIMDDPYKYFLGWYAWTDIYKKWNTEWSAEDIGEEGILTSNQNLFKKIIEDNNDKIMCATSGHEIGIRLKGLMDLGYISIEKNSQIYNYIYKTNILFNKGNLDKNVVNYFNALGDQNIDFSEPSLGLHKCSTYDETGYETLNLVYEFWKYDLKENNGTNKLYDKYVPSGFEIYNDCGCMEQESGTSKKLCNTGDSEDFCTYWSGGQSLWNGSEWVNRWMLGSPCKERFEY